MGPESAKNFPGQQPVHAVARSNPDNVSGPAERAKQEVDYARRGKGYIVGAFVPTIGESLTAPYPGRSAAN